ncbi:WXG100 family type VII secretion target [Nonomuraea sp. B19D2]|uniref:WXG100 family type VII secretion target n=1 Tax=Nonomuraea sp. B19D2 TaxID=3159561 RepID=UPI0032DBEA81
MAEDLRSFTATPEQMIVAAGHVKEAAEAIDSLRRSVGTAIEQLTQMAGGRQGWGGQAANQYRVHMEKWDQICRNKIIRDLEKIFDDLNVTAGVYSNAEADNNLNSLGLTDLDGDGRTDALNLQDSNVPGGRGDIDSLINTYEPIGTNPENAAASR